MLKTLMPSLKELITADYKAVKSTESERIIAEFLSGLTPVLQPELRQISGIPGSGKSTYCDKNLPKNFLLLSFDKIMVSLSGYQQALKEKGAVYAYEKYEMPARIIGYELLRRAISKKYNIMFEHSGANQAHLELFKNLPKKGYKTAVNFIVCDTGLAIERTKKRAKEINRYVPENLVIERANRMKNYVSAYQKLAMQTAYFDGANNFVPLKKI